MIDLNGPASFAVMDPSRPDNLEEIAALGTDAVELAPCSLHGPPMHPFFKVKFWALGPAQQIRLVRVLAARRGMAFDAAFVKAVQLEGISICACGAYICSDPRIGREYFAERDRRGHRGDRP